MSTPEEAPPPAGDGQPAGIHDGGELVGAHYKRLLRHPTILILTGVPVLVAAGGLSARGYLVEAAVAVLLILLVAAGIVYGVAKRLAAADFFALHAERRGMSLEPSPHLLPEATPLLSKGKERYAERTMYGPLGEGFEGTLAHYTYEEEVRTGKGGRSTAYYRFTIVLLELPECARHVPELYCQQRVGFRALEGLEDAFRSKKKRVELESEVLDHWYEIFARKEQDPVWLRRLFSPSFIVWLTDGAPKRFGFELVDGTLCCYVRGQQDSTEELDAIAAAGVAVARRLREEVAETSPREPSSSA